MAEADSMNVDPARSGMPSAAARRRPADRRRIDWVLQPRGDDREGRGIEPGTGPPAKAVAYQLYTHCGIDWERIGGKWLEAQRPLSDGNGNPPNGWSNPYQAGTITMLSATRADFRDAAGHTVILVLQPGVTSPPLLCD